MNIREAKEELIHTVRAYTAKDGEGNYRIPRLRQRPLLLLGPPGIGKTAIVEQAARACGVGLVAYTITHHTRQSAVGLPMLEKKTYAGREVTVTEYTMSEIVAAVYSCIEEAGHREGILFLDEVNCVSETLAPAMLQLLQNKTFGNHRIPAGWVIAAAGNPPEYNSSAREFDIVTLDRVKKLQVEPDYSAWKEYAAAKNLHGAIRSYLDEKPQYFYRVEQDLEKREFVTARGWEDLSIMLEEYERMGVKPGALLMEEYLQCQEAARDFAAYYEFYQKYGALHGEEIRRLCDGEGRGEGLCACPEGERLVLANLLISHAFVLAGRWQNRRWILRRKEEVAGLLLSQGEGTGSDWRPFVFQEFVQNRARALGVKEEMELISEEEAAKERRVDDWLSGELSSLRADSGLTLKDVGAALLRSMEGEREQVESGRKALAGSLMGILGWLYRSFGQTPPFVAAMEAFRAHYVCREILEEEGGRDYLVYSQELSPLKREQALREEIKRLQESEL